MGNLKLSPISLRTQTCFPDLGEDLSNDYNDGIKPLLSSPDYDLLTDIGARKWQANGPRHTENNR